MPSNARSPQKRERQETTQTEEETSSQHTTKEGKSLEEDINKLLDEIDELLAEEDAEEFVTSYVQKGGE